MCVTMTGCSIRTCPQCVALRSSADRAPLRWRRTRSAAPSHAMLWTTNMVHHRGLAMVSTKKRLQRRHKGGKARTLQGHRTPFALARRWGRTADGRGRGRGGRSGQTGFRMAHNRGTRHAHLNKLEVGAGATRHHSATDGGARQNALCRTQHRAKHHECTLGWRRRGAWSRCTCAMRKATATMRCTGTLSASGGPV